jgi:Fe-S-cluster containining protein
MPNISDEEQLDEIYEWIDGNAEIFNNILDEWMENKVVTKVANSQQNTQQEYSCNHCGKCCFTADIYALDISNWINDERFDIICSILPMSDEDDEDEKITFAFPNQKEFIDNIHDILDDNSAPPIVKTAFKRIEEIVKFVNPGFNPNSEYCIYYNPNKKEHCMIYDLRPASCRAYPFDLPLFTDVKIPDNLSDKYGLTEDPNEIEVICPVECFSKKSHKLPTNCTEDDLNSVLVDKVNFLANSIIEEPADFDLMLEYFTKKLKTPRIVTGGMPQQNEKQNAKQDTKQNAKPNSLQNSKSNKKTSSGKQGTEIPEKRILSLSFSGEKLKKEEEERKAAKKSTKKQSKK